MFDIDSLQWNDVLRMTERLTAPEGSPLRIFSFYILVFRLTISDTPDAKKGVCTK